MPYYVILQTVKNVREITMKKLLVTGAVAVLSVLPVASVSADTGSYGSGTNISGSQSEGYDQNARKSSSNSSTNEAYVNKTVSYEALYYVKYDASLTAYTKNTQNANNNASYQQSYFNNTNSQFNMPAYTASYGNY
jgi:hypothetical protein